MSNCLATSSYTCALGAKAAPEGSVGARHVGHCWCGIFRSASTLSRFPSPGWPVWHMV